MSPTNNPSPANSSDSSRTSDPDTCGHPPVSPPPYSAPPSCAIPSPQIQLSTLPPRRASPRTSTESPTRDSTRSRRARSPNLSLLFSLDLNSLNRTRKLPQNLLSLAPPPFPPPAAPPQLPAPCPSPPRSPLSPIPSRRQKQRTPPTQTHSRADNSPSALFRKPANPPNILAAPAPPVLSAPSALFPPRPLHLPAAGRLSFFPSSRGQRTTSWSRGPRFILRTSVLAVRMVGAGHQISTTAVLDSAGSPF